MLFLASIVMLPQVYVEQNAGILRGRGKSQYSWLLLGIFTPLLTIMGCFAVTSIEQMLIIWVAITLLVMILSFIYVYQW